MDLIWHRCNINYYMHEKYYGKVKKLADLVSTKLVENHVFLFYHGIACILEGQVQKGIAELTPLQSHKDIVLAVLIALVYGHKIDRAQDREVVQSLEIKLKEEKRQANAVSYYYAALFLSFAGKYEKASDYVNKSLKKDSNNVDALILKGYNDSYLNRNELKIATIDCLELALNKSNKNPEAMLSLAQCKYFAKDYDASNLILDKLIVSNSGQVVPLISKLRNEFAMQKWEPVYDTLERIFMHDPQCVEALKVRVYLTLCINGDYIEAADQLNKLFSTLESEETYNAFQFYHTAQLFSRTCSKSSAILSLSYRFIQFASELYPNNVDYLSEVGHQCLLQGKTKEALGFFKTASKIDSNSILTLCGLTCCQLLENGVTEQISQQVELLFELQGSKKVPLLYLLSAKLKDKTPTKANSFLKTAFETKVLQVDIYPFSLEYLRELDPEFLLEIYREYKKFLPQKPTVIIDYLTYSQETNDASVSQCLKILETIVNACPGLISGLYELAKLKFLFGFSNDALKLAQQLNELDNTHAPSQLLMSQILIQQEAFPKAQQCLEMCLSYNFKVRDSAMYNFLLGIIAKNTKDYVKALASFTTALNIIKNKNVNKSFDSEMNIIDKATLYVQHIDAYIACEQFTEAAIMMQEAMQVLSCTSEEVRLSIAKADMSLKKGDVDRAIEKLSEIQPGQPYYFQAHTKLAHIYLKEKNDKAMFTNCFKDVVSHHPMTDAHAMMGDAYMSVNEPDQAAEAYEVALKGNPKNLQLIKKLGTAFMKMHEYEKALQHYETAIKTLNEELLKFEYLELLSKLKKYDKADLMITEELNQQYNKEKDINTIKRRVKFLQTQARIREMKSPLAVNTALILTEAKELQVSVVKRLEIDGRGDLQEERRLLSTILCSLAKVKAAREPAVSANLCSEALIHSPRDPDILLMLAKLYSQMNNPEKCEQTCAVLLNSDPNNDAAAVMMADLAFRRADLETAARHIKQILSVRPTSWEALAQYIEVQWRLGTLEEAELALDNAKQALGDEEDDGWYYCAGVCAVYGGRGNAALRLLNRCRRGRAGAAGARGERWGAAAAKRMALLCLAHDASHAFVDSRSGDDTDTRALALRTAEKLIAEVPPDDKKSLQALLQVASKQKSQAEKVLQEALPLIAEDNYQDDPYLILAIATAYNIIKQQTRAKNILKRTISSIPWTPENADGLEKCWLEVAETQVSSGRVDAAKELLNKILNYNKSCSTAYQYLGFLAEKDQNYHSATQNYNNAWIYSGKTNLNVGGKLAHAYLKLKKYPECIIVCRHILKTHPDFPKIRKEVLEKAKANLRT